MDETIKERPVYEFTSENIANFEGPGVYIFRGDDMQPIYIGKSANLRARLTSYKARFLEPKTREMVRNINGFSIIQTTSDVEALLLEAFLVRMLMPKFNIELKDDKHPLYIRITKEEYPRVLTARKADLVGAKDLLVTGPFPSSSAVRSVLRLSRRLFPYAQHTPSKKICLHRQLGLCNPCPSEIEATDDLNKKSALRKKYLRNIRYIRWLLSGRVTQVTKELDRRMRNAAKSQKFELAADLRDKLKHIEYVTTENISPKVFLENPNLIDDVRQAETEELSEILKDHGIFLDKLTRIECFDIAHLQGSAPTASMVTSVNGEPAKEYYRHFRIRGIKGKQNNDVASMKEVIGRRKKYFETWGKPDLILVDGGKAQLAAFKDVLNDKSLPVVGLAKRFETLVFVDENAKFREYLLPKGGARNLVTRIRDEAHRFARRYHHKLLAKELLKSVKN